jgi:hypothetical protein
MFHFFSIAVVLVFVIGVPAMVIYALYQCSPLPHRVSPYRDSVTGKRFWQSPRLDGPPAALDETGKRRWDGPHLDGPSDDL